MKVAFYTLGCKVNQNETGALAQLFYENATAPARQLLQSATGEIAILIGAEGGFDEDEVERAKDAGCSILSLGKRILRCETAPLAALSIIMYETGNME